MAQYRSALGKAVDMSQLAAKNEHTRAVGNMNVNARGDTIDANGKIIVPVTKKVGEAYQRTVANRAANLIRQKNGSGPIEPKEDLIQDLEAETVVTAPPPVVEPVAVEEELLPEEMEFEDEAEAAEIEALKAEEAKSFVVKPASEAPDFVMPDVTTPTKKK